jgi:hypothetical protein
LIRAMTMHDDEFETYCQQCSSLVNQVHATHDANVRTYTQALDRVMNLS